MAERSYSGEEEDRIEELQERIEDLETVSLALKNYALRNAEAVFQLIKRLTHKGALTPEELAWFFNQAPHFPNYMGEDLKFEDLFVPKGAWRSLEDFEKDGSAELAKRLLGEDQ